MKNTLIINLYAGPGAGKSTAAAYIFSKLKMQGIDVELVTEYAKDKTWEACSEAFKCQLYINAKQAFYISRVNGKVDVIITDSPIILGAIYGTEDHVKIASIGEDKKYTNRIDYFLLRDTSRKYNPNGRNQTKDEAEMIDTRIKNILEENNIKYNIINTNIDGFDTIISDVLKRIKKEV